MTRICISRRSLLAAVAAGALPMAACSESPSNAAALDAGAAGAASPQGTSGAAAPSAAPAKVGAQDAYNAAAKGHGFTVGTLMAAHPIYVFFDTACPHCAHLWQASQPLLGKIKMVWMPVAILRRQSAQQGATILQSANPAQTMTQNEALLLENRVGMEPAKDLKPEFLDKINANTEIYRTLGQTSVPLIAYRNNKTGEYGVLTGARTTEQLAALVGL